MTAGDSSDAMKQLRYLAAALKAPRITEAAARLAAQARDAGWTHEDYLAARASTGKSPPATPPAPSCGSAPPDSGVPRGFRTGDPLGSFPGKESVEVAKTKNYSPEFREEAAKMVVETSRAIASVAREIGVSETSLSNWVRAYREDHAGDEPPLRLSDRARLRELERENRELRQKNEFLSKAAAYFASEHR